MAWSKRDRSRDLQNARRRQWAEWKENDESTQQHQKTNEGLPDRESQGQEVHHQQEESKIEAEAGIENESS